MTSDPEHLRHARKVADAVLYEGYLLYPYHQSSQKNQSRFQFGVLMPVAYAELDPSEPSASQTQCLVECGDNAQVQITARFLQLQRRGVQEATESGDFRPVRTLTVDGQEFTAWDEAVEREELITINVDELTSEELTLPFIFGPQTTIEDLTDESGRPAGRIIRTLTASYGIVKVTGERVAGPYGVLRLTIKVENASVPAEPLAHRDDALAYALIATHALISVPGGSFISLTDPPEWASAEVAACKNTGVWPVLAGPPDCRDLMLSLPVILYDHAEVAPESNGDLFDATEIDEILTLRTLALTDAEKQAARATDPRATELMDRLEDLPPEMFDRLHGAIRYLNAVPGAGSSTPAGQSGPAVPGAGTPAGQNGRAGPTLRLPSTGLDDADRVPWWDPGADTSVSPDTDWVIIDGVPISRGSKVIMRPGSRRSDAQDLFLVGRRATVEAVLYDVDDKVHVAVSPDDDPAADLQKSPGRYLYFATDEIEPADRAGSGTPTELEDPA
ncbi:MAG TPA: hypothetical protein VFI65_12650 [Streptosporangiaceae bacterium]|nr:hypothetical protein [Streptosporangiaceae bacterium]